MRTASSVRAARRRCSAGVGLGGGCSARRWTGCRHPPRNGSLLALLALLALLGVAGAVVRAPADAILTAIQQGSTGSALTLDHGNGWRSTLDGVADLLARAGEHVTRGIPLSVLAGDPGSDGASLRMGFSLQGRALDPSLYMLPR